MGKERQKGLVRIQTRKVLNMTHNPISDRLYIPAQSMNQRIWDYNCRPVLRTVRSFHLDGGILCHIALSGLTAGILGLPQLIKSLPASFFTLGCVAGPERSNVMRISNLIRARSAVARPELWHRSVSVPQTQVSV